VTAVRHTLLQLCNVHGQLVQGVVLASARALTWRRSPARRLRHGAGGQRPLPYWAQAPGGTRSP